MAAVEGNVAGHLRELAEVGADEAILVVSPIDERSIRALGEALAALDRGD
jgi:ethanolamine utilization protein EutP (predicted NTPase)